MIYSELIRVGTAGPGIPESSLHPVGVYDQSVCWGRVIQASGDQRPHLLLSPIDPACWPAVFRMQVRLGDAEGAMAIASRLLASHNINILVGECAPSGHTHATWSIVAESLDVRAYAAEAVQRETGPALRRRLKIRLMATLIRLRTAMLAEHRRTPFLSPRFTSSPEPVDADEVRDVLAEAPNAAGDDVDAIADLVSDLWPGALTEAIDFEFTNRLYYYWSQSETLGPSMQFLYDRQSERLQPDGSDNENQWNGFLQSCAGDANMRWPAPLATISIDLRNRLVRLLPYTHMVATRRLISAALKYEVVRAPGADDHSAKGLFAWMVDCMAGEPHHVNLIRATNQILRRNDEHEIGELKLVGRVNETSAATRAALEQELSPENLCDPVDIDEQTWRLTPTVRAAMGIDRLLVSFDQEHPGMDAGFRELCDVAEQHGVMAEPVHDWRDMRPEIERWREEGDIGFLQLATIPRPKDINLTDLLWLARDHTFAAFFDISPLWLAVDTSRLSRAEWLSILDGLEMPPTGIEFASDADPADLRNFFLSIIESCVKIFSQHSRRPG